MRNRHAFGLAVGSAVLAGGLALAIAQPAPPPGMGGPMGGPMMGGQGMEGGMQGPPMGGWHGPWHHFWHHDHELFSLIHTAPDRALSAADVQKIAEALLLWKGNHSWQVIDVKEQDKDKVGFAYATQKGDVIARFTIDRHTGQWQRVN